MEGICNGIDTQEWSPFCDRYLDVKYDASSIEEGKAIAKETLQAELGLDVSPTSSGSIYKAALMNSVVSQFPQVIVQISFKMTL